MARSPHLIRLNQDLLTLQRDIEKATLSIMSTPAGPKERPKFEAMRKKVDSQLAQVAADIEKQFPEYAELTRPAPLKVAEAQKLLAADEALIHIQVGYTESYVFALTREGFAWAPIALDAKAMAGKVTAFRRGLNIEDIDRLHEAQGARFDLAGAHELYRVLIGPVENQIKGKRHLLFVPSGALTALPLHLLVTEPPAALPAGKAIPAKEMLAHYRSAAWLLKRHAVTVLPSVTGLKALRVLARKQQAGKPMIGFGDPVFNAAREGASAPGQRRSAAKTRAYADFWQGAGIDRAKLSEALVRLEDTADELKAVARKLGAAPGDLFLREGASETTVKSMPLGDYRVVYFATHGLVAGDVKGLGEPSLVLTLPQKATDKDDGLLTASEIAALRLNADWVVLSACNTIAGDKPGAEALSGLARAFFYAGARALMVSHWAVEFDRRDAAHDRDLRHPQFQSRSRPRRGAAPRHAGLHERWVPSGERPSGAVGAVLAGRRRRLALATRHRDFDGPRLRFVQPMTAPAAAVSASKSHTPGTAGQSVLKLCSART